MKRRGRFVVLEGLDGAGTTTQAALVAEALREVGHRVVLTREPSDGPLGVFLRKLLTGAVPLPGARLLPEATLALLFAADRLEHLGSTIEPALAAGAVVISDRYVLSSLAYQGRALPVDWVHALNVHAPAPDLTLFLAVSPRVAASRRQRRGGPPERFEDARTQRQVARAYAAVVARSARKHHVRTLDGDRPVEAVASEVKAAVFRLLHRGSTRMRRGVR